jgi:periplasmic copper chaperone A
VAQHETLSTFKEMARRRLATFLWLKIMIKILLTLLTCVYFLVPTSYADNPQVKIENAWLQAIPLVSSDTAAFMTIQNLGQTPIKLVGGSCPIATDVEPMVTTIQVHDGQKVMGMQGVPALEIPAGGTLELKPGGDHLMLMGLKSHPKEGDRVSIVLRFAPGNQEVKADLTVLKQAPK